MIDLALGITNLVWVVNQLSNTQNLTHVAVAREPIWLCAFGPAVLYDGTPLPKTSQLTDCRN